MVDVVSLDSLDRRILQALQADGRLSYEQLAGRVGLSASAVLRRVRRLEQAGVIDGYVALVRAERIGLGLTAYISVSMEKHSGGDKRTPMEHFAAAVQTWPEVTECVSMAGEMDYLLRVVVSDMGHYSRFVMDTLLRHPSVRDCKTSFVLSRVKATTSVPM